MSEPRFSIKAWLELARISNLPTVWTNVLVGTALGLAGAVHPSQRHGLPFGAVKMGLGDAEILVQEDGFQVFWPDNWPLIAAVVTLAAAISCLYIAGMILNDWFDHAADLRDRPTRPLPSGRVGRRAALIASVALISVGLLLLGVTRGVHAVWLGGILTALIVAYDAVHKRTPFAVILMGACRGMVYLVCAVPLIIHYQLAAHDRLMIDAPIWWLVGAISLYTMGITIIARGETADRIDARKWLAIVMPIGVLAMLAVVHPPGHWRDDAPPWLWAAGAGFILSLWLAQAVRYVLERPPKTMRAVLTWLSGMCLVDAYFLTLLDMRAAAIAAGVCFVLTAWGHRKILGT